MFKGCGRKGRPNNWVYLSRSPNALAKQDVRRREKLKEKVEPGEMSQAASEIRLEELRIQAKSRRDDARDREVARRREPPRPAPTMSSSHTCGRCSSP